METASQSLLSSVLGTGFAVAFLHAALPTHWLPFVLAAKGQGWSPGKTLAVTVGAGIGHVLATALLGVLVVWIGLEANEAIGRVFPALAGGVLIAIGLYYLVRQVRGRAGHHHWELRRVGVRSPGHRHELPIDPASARSTEIIRAEQPRRSDLAVIAGLLTLLTFSPCEAFLPVYLSGLPFGWRGFAVLSLALSAATLSGMVLFTWATLAGLGRLPLQRLERFESGILGALLCLLGLIVFVFEA